MAGVSTKDIKQRIRSMESTRQITRAMEMVAASKMNKAQEIALRTRPYYTTLHQTLSRIAAATRDFSSPYLQKREEKRICCIAIAGDRGLAGGYNSNVLRLAASTLTTLSHNPPNDYEDPHTRQHKTDLALTNT